jgi:hypothetical protein
MSFFTIATILSSTHILVHCRFSMHTTLLIELFGLKGLFPNLFENCPRQGLGFHSSVSFIPLQLS